MAVSPLLRPDAPARHIVHLEPSPRRVRVEFAGQIIADSRTPLLVLETGHLPVYYFPWADLRQSALLESAHRTRCPYKGEAHYWHLKLGPTMRENAVWAYPTPIPEAAGLAGHGAFYWQKVDRWFEEDEEIIRHPRDPYHRVDVVPSTRSIEAVLRNEILSRSNQALFVFETGMPVRYYLPRADIRMDLLIESSTVTQCPYKGTARYWSARIDGNIVPDIAWSYEQPLPECPRIAGRISFYSEKLDRLTVD